MPFEGYRITSPFGWRTSPIRGGKEFHTGVDLVKYHKSPIEAFTEGIVLYAGEGKSGTGFGGYGNVVLVKDKNSRGHVYAHLDSVAVYKGQQISKGQVVGYQGNTGQSTGSHLHYEIRKRAEDKIPYGWEQNRADNCLDPTTYLNTYYVSQIHNNVKGTDDKLKLDADWKYQMLEQTLNNLHNKGILNNTDWAEKCKNRQLTVDELTWLTMITLDRVTNK